MEEQALLNFRMALDYCKQKTERLLLSMMSHNKKLKGGWSEEAVLQSANTVRHDTEAFHTTKDALKTALDAVETMENVSL